MSTNITTEKKVDILIDVLKVLVFLIDIAPEVARKFNNLLDKLDKDDTTQEDIDKVRAEIKENVIKILARKKV